MRTGTVECGLEFRGRICDPEEYRSLLYKGEIIVHVHLGIAISRYGDAEGFHGKGRCRHHCTCQNDETDNNKVHIFHGDWYWMKVVKRLVDSRSYDLFCRDSHKTDDTRARLAIPEVT